MVKISVVVVSNKLGGMSAKVRPAVRPVVQKTVYDVVAGCQVRSRVDTGEMRAAWHGEMLSDTEGEVTNGTKQVIYNEYGTVHMSAQPMAHPASDAARPGFEAGIRQALAGLV
jgi:hypothetical protein